MLYLYGVVRAGHERPTCKGVGSPPGDVSLVESGPVAAAVTQLPDDFAVQDEDARAHLHVLIELLTDGPVLPLRMGTVAPDDDAIRAEVLDAGCSALVDQLDALDGLIELHVDADDDEAEAIASIARSVGVRRDTATDLQSTLELGHEIADLLVDRRQQLSEEILAELRPYAVRDTARAVIAGPEDPVLRWAFLVKRDDLELFDKAVTAVRTHHPTTAIRYLGPLPAAHFIDWQRSERAQLPEDDTSGAQNAWGW